jgi:Ca2+-transporting ATPase
MGHDNPEALGQTMAFAVLGLSQLFHVRNLHSNKISSFKTSILNNKSLLLAVLTSSILMLIVMMVPPVMDVFGLVPIDGTHWIYIIGLSLVPIVIVELVKALKLNHTKDEY